jgi:hypothetical protein
MGARHGLVSATTVRDGRQAERPAGQGNQMDQWTNGPMDQNLNQEAESQRDMGATRGAGTLLW